MLIYDNSRVNVCSDVICDAVCAHNVDRHAQVIIVMMRYHNFDCFFLRYAVGEEVTAITILDGPKIRPAVEQLIQWLHSIKSVYCS